MGNHLMFSFSLMVVVGVIVTSMRMYECLISCCSRRCSMVTAFVVVSVPSMYVFSLSILFDAVSMDSPMCILPPISPQYFLYGLLSRLRRSILFCFLHAMSMTESGFKCSLKNGTYFSYSCESMYCSLFFCSIPARRNFCV